MREKLENVSSRQGGVYSTSVLWSHIIKHLLTIRTPVSFYTASNACKLLGIIHDRSNWKKFVLKDLALPKSPI